MNVEVMFTPTSESDYNARIPIKIHSNSRGKFLSCKGRGKDLNIRFNAPKITLEPTMPFAAHKRVTLEVSNPTDYPLEFFSVDFDKTYLEEEAVLSRNQSYNNRSILYVTPRGPGDGLHESILEEEKERVRVEAEEKAAAEAAAAAAKAAEDGVAGGDAGGDGDVTKAAEDGGAAGVNAGDDGAAADASADAGTADAGADDDAVGEIVMQDKAKTEEEKKEGDPKMRKYGLARDLLVLAPPFLGRDDAGQAVLSAKLAEKYEAVECTLDSIVSKCVDDMTPFGLKAELLLPFEPLPAEEVEQMDETAKAKYEAKVERIEAGKQAHADAAAVDAAAFDGPGATDATAGGDAAAEGGGKTELFLPRDILAGLIKDRVLMADAQKGMVISGTESVHAGSAAEVASVVLEALSSRAAGNGNRFQVVRLAVSEEEYVARLVGYQQALKKAEAKIAAASGDAPASGGDGAAAETKGDGDAEPTEEELAQKAAEAKAREEHALLVQRALAEFATAFPVPEKVEKEEGAGGDDGDAAATAADAAVTETKGDGDDDAVADNVAAEETKVAEEESARMSDEDHMAVKMRECLAAYTAAELKVLESLEISPEQLEGKPESVHTDIGYEEEKDPCLQRSLVVDLSAASDSDISGLIAIVEKAVPAPPSSALIADYLAIPATKTLAIIKRPLGRPGLKPTNKFRLLTLGLPTEIVDESVAAAAAVAAASGDAADDAAGGGGGDDDAATAADEGVAAAEDAQPAEDNFFLKDELSEEQVEALDEDARAEYEEKLARRYATRWVLPPRSKIPIGVEFASEEVGAFSRTLGFEIVGRKASYRMSCDAVCACPTINKNPRNVFMSRKKRPQKKSKKRSAIVRKAYIASRSRYEFGPLLVGMDRTVAKSKEGALADEIAADVARRANAESFRITNGDLFPAHVTLAFKDCDAASDDAPFIVSPAELELEQGETKNVVVWAYPGEDKEFTDVLVCSVKDNPDVVEFPVHCVGGRPKIELHGPWESANGGAAAAAGGDAAAGDAAGAGDAADAAAAASVEPVIDFERLLLRRSEERVLKIDNTCPISIGWRLKCESLDALEEFTITPASGLLHAGKSASVRVNFESIKEEQFEENIEVEYFAAVDANGRELTSLEGHTPATVESMSVKVKAEAYDIKYTVPEFHEEAAAGDDAAAAAEKKKAKKDGELDFGILRVGESLEKTFTLRNQGKYAIKFDFGIRRKSTKECFTVTPSQGALEPEGSTEITVKFTSERVVRFKNTKDIRCSVQEPTTGELFESFDLTVSAESVYSTFRLQPQSGVNFGASHYGNEKTRRIEVRNDGEFEFTYRALKKAVADEGFDPVEVVDGALELGPFTLEPQGGVIAPKESLEILCKFKAEGEAISKETLHISISGRDPKDPRGTVFELSGESCIPGINVTEFETIFEEQAVERRLQEDVAFDSRTLYAVEDGTFSFGSVVPSMLPEQGMAERFKLVNPNKIKAIVDLEVDGNECFAVHPTSVDVPSHESRYVTMYFKPTGMQKYQGKLTATVRDGTDPETNSLDFALLGEVGFGVEQERRMFNSGN